MDRVAISREDPRRQRKPPNRRVLDSLADSNGVYKSDFIPGSVAARMQGDAIQPHLKMVTARRAADRSIIEKARAEPLGEHTAIRVRLDIDLRRRPGWSSTYSQR